MGRKYLRLYWEELAASESWKKLDPKNRAHALYDLVQGVMDGGGVPPMWKRVAEQREIGEKPTPGAGSLYLPFRRHWEDSWKTLKREAFLWDPRQFGALRSCYTKADGDLEAFKFRVAALFSKMDSFTEARLSCVLLAAKWNELGPSKPKKLKSAYSCGRCGKLHASLRCPA